MRHDRARDIDELIGGKSPKSIKSELTTREAAEFFGVQQRTIQQLITKGVFEPLPSGKLDVRDSTRAYIAAVRKGTGTKLEDAKLRLANEQADKIEIQNAAARRELLPASEVEREWSSALRDLRASLLALPSRVQQRLPHMTAHDMAALDREIRDALTELAGDD